MVRMEISSPHSNSTSIHTRRILHRIIIALKPSDTSVSDYRDVAHAILNYLMPYSAIIAKPRSAACRNNIKFMHNSSARDRKIQAPIRQFAEPSLQKLCWLLVRHRCV